MRTRAELLEDGYTFRPMGDPVRLYAVAEGRPSYRSLDGARFLPTWEWWESEEDVQAMLAEDLRMHWRATS